MNPHARDQCLIEVTILRPTPNLAIDSSSEKIDRGAAGLRLAMLSKAFRNHSCLSGKVSCPENCREGIVKESGTTKSTGGCPQSAIGRLEKPSSGECKAFSVEKGRPWSQLICFQLYMATTVGGCALRSCGDTRFTSDPGSSRDSVCASFKPMECR